MKPRFIELHGELADARAELKFSIRTCRALFAMRGPFDTHALIAQLRKIQAASEFVDRAAFALERYVNTHSR